MLGGDAWWRFYFAVGPEGEGVTTGSGDGLVYK